MEKKELLIIIPAYNEGKNIRQVLTDLEGLDMKIREIGRAHV